MTTIKISEIEPNEQAYWVVINGIKYLGNRDAIRAKIADLQEA